MGQFDGQRVIVVGASSGIGLATAKAFAAAGAQVVVAARAGDRLQRAAEEVGHGATALALDTGDQSAIAAAFAGEAYDHVAITAAQTVTGPTREMSLEDAYKSMDSKFWGAYRVARSVRISGNGSLTFISGGLAVRPSKTSVLQGAINAGLEGLARGLALELAPVRVNTVSPGIIETPLYARMEPVAREAMLRSTAERLPVGRVGQAEDLASAILFIAGNGFITGTTLRVDGGGAIA